MNIPIDNHYPCPCCGKLKAPGSQLMCNDCLKPLAEPIKEPSLNSKVKIPKTNPLEKKPSKGLLDAIKFIKPIQSKAKNATVEQRHCFICNGWLVAGDGVVTAGSKIEEEFNACPNTGQLEEALKQVKTELSITVIGDTLSLVSGDLKALIPCTSPKTLTIPGPDTRICPLDPCLLDALDVLEPLTTSRPSEPVTSSVLLKSGFAVATNRRALVEYWTGIDLPTILVPREAVKAILRSKKELEGFGYSGPSATFWFTDGSFIKTQLYNELYPNYTEWLEFDGECIDIPDHFFKAVKIIKNLTTDGKLHFSNNKIQSDELEADSSTYVIDGLPEGIEFNAEWLLSIEKAVERMYFDIEGKRAYFYGNRCRGIIEAVKC